MVRTIYLGENNKQVSFGAEMMKLAIVSHTEHYTAPDGTILGWGPTVSELNHLAPHFEKIYHVATLHNKEAPPSSLPYTATNIEFLPLKPTGGPSLKEKLAIITNIPRTITTVRKVLKKVDAFQLRTPTGIGVYLIPYLNYFTKKPGWYKYAGNWAQENAPLGYALQRKMLTNQNRTVTINGSWPNQPSHCYTFENPCLTLEERHEGLEIIKNKNYEPPFIFCFVGRLDDAKGVQRIIDAFSNMDLSWVEKIHFIGNGERFEAYKNQSKTHKIPAVFHGFLSRNEVFEIYRKSHFLVLPSTASEGFPKVIAEGMNFGCIPVVSNVSSIGQYITNHNGYVISPCNSEMLQEVFNIIKNERTDALEKRAINGYAVASKFTFAHYTNRILKEILNFI